MKKFSFFIVIFVVSFLFYSCRCSASVRDDFFESEFIVEYGFVATTGHNGNFQHFTRKADGEIAYCIEPGVSLSTDVYEGFYDISLNEKALKVGLSKEQLHRVSLIAHFGWGYEGHSGNDWIVATQTLIWKETGRDIQFTSRYNPDNPWKYVIDVPQEIQSHMAEIERLIHEYTSSLFSVDRVWIPYKGTYEFVDSTDRLSFYKVRFCNNCTYKKNENNLTIQPLSYRMGGIMLERQSKGWEKDFIVYYSSIGQNMIVPGYVEPVSSYLTFEIQFGTLTINKYDKDNKTCFPKEGGSLEGSIYYLYKEDGTFLKELTIDSNCRASLSPIELGKYYIQEFKPGENYELDLDKYYFEFTPTELNKELTVYDKMYLGQVEVIKHDSKTNSCKSSSSYATLSGAIYGIYKKDGTLLEKVSINEECKGLSTRNLLLGEYYLQEITPPKGYKLDLKKYNFEVNKENADGIISLTLHDDIYEQNIVIYKTYSYFGGKFPEAYAEFVIYSKQNNKKVATLVTNELGYASIVLPYGEYILKQIKGREGYHLQEDISFTILENIESKQLFDLVNQPYLGKLEFIKMDANTEQLLSGAFIEIYNEQDVLIFQGKTDEAGKIVIDNLAYGKYYIKEKEAPKGYALSLDKLYFEIKEDGQVVSLQFENEKEVFVPSTGIREIPKSILFAICFMFLGAFCIIYGKKKV